MGNYQFNKDIAIGDFGEKIIIRDLARNGISFVSDNKDNKYDLLMEKGKKQVTYEVKTDVFCFPDKDTGNLFIEYESRGKDSGIAVTQAKWFATYFKHLKEIWYIKTEDLKELMVENEFKKIEFGGDIDSNTKGVLIPRYKFKNKFIVKHVPKKWLEVNETTKTNN